MYNGEKKVCLVGEACVGKSTFVRRLKYPEREIYGKYTPTIGFELSTIEIPMPDGAQPKKVSIWDLAGNPRYGGLRDAYLISADVIFVVVKDERDYEEVKCKWERSHPLMRERTCIVKPLVLNEKNVDIEDLESCYRAMREIVA